MSQTLTVVARIRARPGQEARVRELLLSLVAPTRAEAGCINYDLHESAGDPGEFLFHENWTGPEALAAHFETAHMQQTRRLLQDAVAAPTEITRWHRVL